MSKRDREVVEDYKKVFASVFDTPHLSPVEGQWYLVQYQEEPSWVVNIEKNEGGPLGKEELIKRGYTVTPLLIYKVDTEKVR